MASKRELLLTPEDIQFADNLKFMIHVLDISQKDFSEFFSINRVMTNNYINHRAHVTVPILIAMEQNTGIPMISWVTRKVEASELPKKLGQLNERVEEPQTRYHVDRLAAIEKRLSRIEEVLKLPNVGDK